MILYDRTHFLIASRTMEHEKEIDGPRRQREANCWFLKCGAMEIITPISWRRKYPIASAAPTCSPDNASNSAGVRRSRVSTRRTLACSGSRPWA